MNLERIRELVAQPSVDLRLEGLALAEATGAGLATVFGLLDDEAPYVFLHGDRRMIGEVRMRALVVMETLCRLAGRPPDFGPVRVRRAMPADEAEGRATEALARLNREAAQSLARRATLYLAQQVRPQPKDEPSLIAYRILQVLGLVSYAVEDVDPVTYLTPTQEAVHASQVAAPRPCPHLCVRADASDRAAVSDRAAAGEILGYVYRARDARLALDFAETASAEDARRYTMAVLGIERRGLPRVLRGLDGAPRTDADGSLVLDGVHSLSEEDPVPLLESLQAFLARRYQVDLVLRGERELP